MKRYLLIMIMIIYTACTEAQIRSLQNYAVITFEQAVKKEKQSFYWIIPIDSLNSIKTLPTKIPLYPLYLDDCSEANYHRCIEGNMISYLDNYASSSENYEKFIMNVMDIVISHRKLLETIEICWENRSDKKLYLEELKEKKELYPFIARHSLGSLPVVQYVKTKIWVAIILAMYLYQ